jgi:hypothetical protein
LGYCCFLLSTRILTLGAVVFMPLCEKVTPGDSNLQVVETETTIARGTRERFFTSDIPERPTVVSLGQSGNSACHS